MSYRRRPSSQYASRRRRPKPRLLAKAKRGARSPPKSETVRITTKRSGQFREFYKGGERIAFYSISEDDDPKLNIYSYILRKTKEGIDSLSLSKSDLVERMSLAEELLSKYLPEELAEKIIVFARRDLGLDSS
jgi:hypothetical protein